MMSEEEKKKVFDNAFKEYVSDKNNRDKDLIELTNGAVEAGMKAITELKELRDYYEWEFCSDEENTEDEMRVRIIDEGKEILLPYEMTLSTDYPDHLCMRVFYKGEYYYFG